jgi:hypothetical protein
MYCEGKVCQGIDIRNSPAGLRKLEGCTVIEGFLRIDLMDNAVESDFENITFPELREVVSYVLFYRVTGLLSIRQLFPNLSVIRGQSLVLDYALLISQMPNLQDVSLPNLTILRGGVAVVKNPSKSPFLILSSIFFLLKGFWVSRLTSPRIQKIRTQCRRFSNYNTR